MQHLSSMERGESDARTDLYGFGATLYYCVTGKDPSDNPFHFEPPSKINPKVQARLEKAILKCVQLNPAERFSSVDEMRLYLFGSDSRTADISPDLTGTLPKEKPVAAPKITLS